MRGRSGFTLVEVMLVMVILGILATIAVPRLNVSRQRAFRSAVLSDLKSVANLQDIYHNIYYTYTTDATALEYTGSEGVFLTVNVAGQQGWGATATHAGIDEGQCGIFYGDAAASSGDPATTAGVAVCDF